MDFFPTHKHSPELWEHLGRVVATFGYLEEILARAWVSITYNQKRLSEAERIIEETRKDLLSVMTSPLAFLLKKYKKVTEDLSHQFDIESLYQEIEKAIMIRNNLCHATWQYPDGDGMSELFYFKMTEDKKDIESLVPKVGVDFLKKTQSGVVEITRLVRKSVTDQGINFIGT